MNLLSTGPPESRFRGVFLRRVVPVIAILILIAVLYLPTLHYTFQFDDAIFLRDGNLRAGRLEAFLWPPVPRLVAWTSFTAQFHLFGEDPAAFRLFNVTLHALNSVLVFCMILLVWARLGRRVWEESERWVGAITGAVVFAVHPLAIESVVYIYQRSTLLATAFALVASLLWVGARARTGRDLSAWRTALIVAAYGLAVASKEFVILLPLLLWCYDGLLTRRWTPRREVVWIGLAGIAAGLALLSQIELDAGVGRALLYSRTQVWAWWQYLLLALLPVGLNVDHHLLPAAGLFDLRWWLAFAGLVGLAGLSWSVARGRPLLRFWMVLYGVFLLPTSSLVPSPDFFFEHRVYASLAGYAGLLAWGTGALWRREGRRCWTVGKPALLAVFTLGALLLCQLNLERTRVWKDAVTLWRDSAQRSPTKYRPNFNLGVALMDSAPDKAREHLSRAIEIDPANPRAYRSLAQIEFHLGNFDSARRLWLQSLILEPDDPATLLALGKLHIQRRDYASAIKVLEAARKVEPHDPEIRYHSAALHLRLGLSRQAVEQAEQGLSHHPDHVPLRVLLAEAVAARHNWPRAVELYEEALAREPNSLVYYRLANAYRALGETNRAREAVKRGIEVAETEAERSTGEGLLRVLRE